MSIKRDDVITPDLRARIIQAVKRRAPCLLHDAEDVAQTVLLQVWAKPHLAEPNNIGLLMNHVKYAVLHALRSARRHDARGNARFTSYEQLFNEASYNASEC